MNHFLNEKQTGRLADMSNSYSHKVSVCKLARLPISVGSDSSWLPAEDPMKTIVRCKWYLDNTERETKWSIYGYAKRFYSPKSIFCKPDRFPIFAGSDVSWFSSEKTMKRIVRRKWYLNHFLKEKQSELSTDMQNGATHTSIVPLSLIDCQSQLAVTEAYWTLRRQCKQLWDANDIWIALKEK